MILTIIGLAIFSDSEAWGEDWKLFSVGSMKLLQTFT